MITSTIVAAMFSLGLSAQVGSPTTATPTTGRVSAGENGGYFEVPLKGEFGKEITAPGVRDAMRTARKRNATAIVFVFDTPGGRVSDAQAIAAVIDKERVGERGEPDLKVYAVVQRALSASVWPMAHCDRIFFAPGAAAGAAVAFHWDLKSGNAEVDAKFNAAVTAEVASAAEAHGQAGCVYRAMMLQDAKLFGWATTDGKYSVSDSRPTAAVKELEEIDTPVTVLAWTTTQAAKYGFGTVMPSKDVTCVGALLGAAEWKSAGDMGASVMTRAYKDVEKRAGDTERAKDAIVRAREQVLSTAKMIAATGNMAEAAEPQKSVQVRYTGQGLFTAQTQMEWRNQTDKAIQGWNSVSTLLGDLERAEKQALQAVENYNAVHVRECQFRLYTDKPEPLKVEPVEHNVDPKVVRKFVSDALSRLNAGRLKNRL